MSALSTRPACQPTDASATGDPCVVAAEGLEVAYGPTQALDGVDVSIAAGEVVAVVGASGSGKSTLLHCLAGLRVPDRGRVVFEGVDLAELGDHGRSRIRLRSMGVVFQFGELLPELTLAENVAIPLWVTGHRRVESVASAQVHLDALGIGHLAGRYPGDVSGGERQRAAIARSLVHRPSVLFADEPTGSLDSVNAENVMEILIAQAREQNTAVVLVTHEPRYAERCDRSLHVLDGQIFDP